MGVDQTSLDRIRNATFPSSKRGYDKQEVEKFLSRLADWLETGGGDESRSDTVKRELERVGERTGAILSQAEDSAQQIIADAEAKADRIVEDGARRREDVEAVISDLARRRDDLLADIEELSSKLTTAVSEHRPAEPDPFDKPEELDPLAGDDALDDAQDDAHDEDVEEDSDEGFDEEPKTAETEKAPANER